MTSLALISKSASVGVVPLMASGTYFWEFHFRFDFFGVTCFALQPRMGPVEFEFRLSVVVKLPQIPMVGVVAGFATRAQTFFVEIIFEMAIDTIRLDRVEFHGRMAIVASRDRVNSDERKFRQVMIELDIFSPRRVVMATIAFLAFLPFMNIIGLMTAVTGFGNLHLFLDRLGMA